MVPIALHGVLDPDDRHNKGPRPKRKAQNKNELEAQRPSRASKARRGAARRGNLLAGLVLAGELGLSISLSVKPAPLMAMTMDKSAVAAEVAAAVNMVRERWEALTQHGAQLATQLANRLIESSYTGDPSNWAGLESNADLRKLVAAKMDVARSTLVLRLEQNIRELEAQYDEFKRVVYRLESACDMLSRSDQLAQSELSFRFKVSTLLDTEILLKDLLTSLGQDMQCKRDVCKGLRQLTLAPEAFNASTHEHLTLYLAIWTEAPLAEMRKFRIAEVALLAEV